MTEHTLPGKNVLIAAGAKNLGGLIARQAAEAGANVAIHYNSDSTRPEAERTLAAVEAAGVKGAMLQGDLTVPANVEDRKSTRLNSSHVAISYAVFCLKQKMKKLIIQA